MKRVILFYFATLLILPFAAYSDPACEGPYGICMAACATNRAAERCMQRCMSRRDQCTVLNLPLRIAEQEALAEGARKFRRHPKKETFRSGRVTREVGAQIPAR